MPFEKGKYNGGGRRKGQVSPQTRLRNKIAESVTEEDVLSVINAMKSKAEEGDSACAKVYLEYTAGKPDSNINVSGGMDWSGLAEECP